MKNQDVIKALAKIMASYFEEIDRPNGTRCWRMLDNSPKMVQELVFAVHRDILPDDWRHAFMVYSLTGIAEHEGDLEDLILIYPVKNDLTKDSELIDWLTSDASREYLMDRLGEDFNTGDALDSDWNTAGIAQQIRTGMFFELKYIKNVTLEFLASFADILSDHKPAQ